MSYGQIVPRERVLIEEYVLANKSLSYIAKQSGWSKSTISYELDRCGPYTAAGAQLDYETER